MRESHLERVVRLAGGAVRVTKPTAVKDGQPRLGRPYRVAWSKVNVGDIIQMGAELWKVIAAPAFKPPKGGKNAKVGLAAPLPGAKPMPKPGQPGAQPMPGQPQVQEPGMAPAVPAPSPQVYTHYLENLHKPGDQDHLTLPGDHVVTVVPLLP
jgi:hypothetical protein